MITSAMMNSMRMALNRVGPGRYFTTSTAPRMKPFPVVASDSPTSKPLVRADFVPIYVALGMISLAGALGIHTATHQMRRAPNVFVSKKKREMLPEVVMPDEVAKDSDEFMHKSIFRKIAHLQDKGEDNVPNPISRNGLASEKKFETLKSVGVDPQKM